MNKANSQLPRVIGRDNDTQDNDISIKGESINTPGSKDMGIKRQFGQFKGEFEMAEDFDSLPLNDAIGELFESDK